MSGKRLMGIATAVILGAAMLAAPADVHAKKKCPKVCKTQVKDCKDAAKAANDCTGLKGTEKKACKQALKDAKKACKGILATCAAHEGQVADDVCSASAAFLD
ncbi:MAG: hypothetical protein U0807_07150 [Candidatus Binatia bacterium]